MSIPNFSLFKPAIESTIRDIDNGDTSKAKEKLSGILDRVIEIQHTVIRIQDENVALKKAVEELKSEKARAEGLDRKHGVYWEKDKPDTPICARCYEDEGKFIPLYEDRESSPYVWYCKKCNANYEMPDSPSSLEIDLPHLL